MPFQIPSELQSREFLSRSTCNNRTACYTHIFNLQKPNVKPCDKLHMAAVPAMLEAAKKIKHRLLCY